VAHSHDIRENVLWFGTRGHVSSSERAPGGGASGWFPKGGFRKAYSGGWHRVVRLEIDDRDSSFRSGRMNCSERRWPLDSRWAATIDSLGRAEAGYDRTERKGRAMWTVGS